MANAVQPMLRLKKGWEEEKNDSLIQVIQTIPIRECSNGVYVDFIERPEPFFSDKLKRIIELYQQDLAYRPVVFVDQKRSKQELYWRVTLPRLAALSTKSEFHKVGTVKRFVIDDKKAGRAPIFQLEGMDETDIFVHLGLAESILRREVVGIEFEEVELDCGEVK